MKKSMRYIKRTLLFLTAITCLLTGFTPETTHAFTPQVIQKGATGDDVIELQSRLQYIGFYNGPIDGVFSWRTYWALRNFQYENKLKVDGLAGFTTKKKLADQTKFDYGWVHKQIRKGNKFTTYGGVPKEKQVKKSKGKTGAGAKAAPAKQGAKGKSAKPGAKAAVKVRTPKQGSNIPDGYSQNDINLMANAVYGESRGEKYIGQVAVAAVIINRVENSEFPNTVSGVIFEPGAFTAVADGQIYLTPNEKAKKAVMDALNGWDPTGEALYYFNPDTATSGWIWTRPQIKKIGKHIYTK
ncbi:spore cortex-lytic enzyme [Fictibacillus fluitans]|uniref:Spore cortex-lytic enzyme n=1 Tax=Fictibacillus fluitans TaxID=3058422 RepID=A0ABT8I3J6_9BACL|nr:spore cortex-lytic enzyme [Fictibacillus sp. NE201]MDN4527610.1 spore cortex-lytic enzyme [Fictibacillus sp. NE201]